MTETPLSGADAADPRGDAPTGAAGSNPSKESESYTHGHHESVLRSHRWRTAENSAGFLLPHLREGMSVLDVGCGPATVTVDLAERVAGGRVVGVDASAAVLDSARDLAAQRGTANITFQQANAYELPFADGTFDVVYAHQLLQHLSDPIGALREMKRVAKPGGLVAVRDADYAAMTWYPESPGLTEWNTLYHEVTHAYGFEADAGRRLFAWVQDAGFDLAGIVPSASTWCYATPEDRTWWGGLWAERCVASNFAVQAQESALADDVALELLAQDWLRWAEEPAGWFAVLNGEVLARV
ncbi:methyltransferase domain-containing protein [Cellulosimicrobium sp. Marseille-Q4280]|jgi:ubiquinone/menaquinone biosynthesis C-methylase UbiE|uniref:methyltransferase domain-containing protein n=1 Tax=Cellulosimicrobium sp. Marseille-Q4280 TaxID=2937992 RepID=UPI0020413C07|nr:methyltransferase domain-containing protein [Cellulosimicrobium sp. Marseille-Q4280]